MAVGGSPCTLPLPSYRSICPRRRSGRASRYKPAPSRCARQCSWQMDGGRFQGCQMQTADPNLPVVPADRAQLATTLARTTLGCLRSRPRPAESRGAPECAACTRLPRTRDDFRHREEWNQPFPDPRRLTRVIHRAVSRSAEKGVSPTIRRISDRGSATKVLSRCAFCRK